MMRTTVILILIIAGCLPTGAAKVEVAPDGSEKIIVRRSDKIHLMTKGSVFEMYKNNNEQGQPYFTIKEKRPQGLDDNVEKIWVGIYGGVYSDQEFFPKRGVIVQIFAQYKDGKQELIYKYDFYPTPLSEDEYASYIKDMCGADTTASTFEKYSQIVRKKYTSNNEIERADSLTFSKYSKIVQNEQNYVRRLFSEEDPSNKISKYWQDYRRQFKLNYLNYGTYVFAISYYVVFE